MKLCRKWRRLVGPGLLAVAMASQAAILAGVSHAAAAQSQSSPAKAESASEETSIRALAESFTKAFNEGNARAVAALWADDADYTDEAGRTLHGRDAIEKAFGQLFAGRPGLKATVTVDSIRLLSPDVAIEKGVTRVAPADGGPASAARYTLVLVKRNAQWLIASGRDCPHVATSSQERLKDLEWIIGQWAAAGQSRSVQLKAEWLNQKNFIRRTYTVTEGGRAGQSGTQIIGWDPRLGRMVSWHFDADGGFGHEVWIRDGARWVIEATGVLPDGSQSTALNILIPLDNKSFTWQSVRRRLEGVSLPDTPTVTVTRVESSP